MKIQEESHKSYKARLIVVFPTKRDPLVWNFLQSASIRVIIIIIINNNIIIIVIIIIIIIINIININIIIIIVVVITSGALPKG